MASAMATWTPSSLQLRIALNCRSFKAAPARAKLTKLSPRLRTSCAAHNAESGRGSDLFRGWADSGDDEMSRDSGGGDWYKGTLVSGVAGMVLFVGLALGARSFKRHVLTKPKVEVMVSESSSDQVGETSHERGNLMDQDEKESYKDSPVLESKSASTSKENHEANKSSESRADRVDTDASQIPDEEKKHRCYTGIPAPSTVPQVNPLSPIFPTVVDPIQSQMFAALQALKVIESDARPYDLCTRREFARWLVSASNVLSRNSASKVYPAMYIENVTELAFDDIAPEDPDFPFIQGLAEAGIISSKLSNHNMPSAESGHLKFSPESPLSRQDLLSWKMALEFRQLPEADSKKLYQLSGFLDIDKINPEAWPALIADLSAGENGITSVAFGRTRLFQPSKAVTKAQTAASLATGEACEAVSEELARIQAEAMAENVVSAHNALVAQVEKEINATFEKELLRETETVDAVVKLAEEAKRELTRLRVVKEEETLALEKERTSIETEMESLARLRNELEEQLQGLVSNKAEMSFEKERFGRLQKQVEKENEERIDCDWDPGTSLEKVQEIVLKMAGCLLALDVIVDLVNRTWFLTVNLIDRSMSKKAVMRMKLQLEENKKMLGNLQYTVEQFQSHVALVSVEVMFHFTRSPEIHQVTVDEVLSRKDEHYDHVTKCKQAYTAGSKEEDQDIWLGTARQTQVMLASFHRNKEQFEFVTVKDDGHSRSLLGKDVNSNIAMETAVKRFCFQEGFSFATEESQHLSFRKLEKESGMCDEKSTAITCIYLQP